MKVELPDRVGRIDQSIDPALARHRRDLRDRQHQPGAVAEVGEKDHPDRRIGVERGAIGFDQRRARRGLGERDLDHLDAAMPGQRIHARLHAVIVEVGVEHRVAGLEAIVLQDQHLHRLGRVAGEGDLVDADAHRARERGANPFEIGDHGPARIIRGVAVHPLDLRLVGREDGTSHHPPIAVLELDDLAGHVIFARDPLPVVGGCRAGDGGRGEGQSGGAEHGPAVDLHAAFLGQMRR